MEKLRNWDLDLGAFKKRADNNEDTSRVLGPNKIPMDENSLTISSYLLF